jgi:hypothetical protein
MQEYYTTSCICAVFAETNPIFIRDINWWTRCLPGMGSINGVNASKGWLGREDSNLRMVESKSAAVGLVAGVGFEPTTKVMRLRASPHQIPIDQEQSVTPVCPKQKRVVTTKCSAA